MIGNKNKEKHLCIYYNYLIFIVIHIIFNKCLFLYACIYIYKKTLNTINNDFEIGIHLLSKKTNIIHSINNNISNKKYEFIFLTR